MTLIIKEQASAWMSQTTSPIADKADPIDDVNAGKLWMRSASGLLPEVFIISYSDFIKRRASLQLPLDIPKS